ncbi:hypothetical protein, partial [Mesorhizobium sp.]|uniref:hypothetical protein n=1 Tax=Mesorhizobium sp. TaxID=1871066 RepID=UPI0025C00EB9
GESPKRKAVEEEEPEGQRPANAPWGHPGIWTGRALSQNYCHADANVLFVDAPVTSYGRRDLITKRRPENAAGEL